MASDNFACVPLLLFTCVPLLLLLLLGGFYDTFEISKPREMWQNLDHKIILYLIIEIYKLNYM